MITPYIDSRAQAGIFRQLRQMGQNLTVFLSLFFLFILYQTFGTKVGRLDNSK